jgi:hypothetical protein
MSGTSVSPNNPVRILSPSDTLRPCADAVVKITHIVIVSSESPDPAMRFDLRAEFTPVIKEAKRPLLRGIEYLNMSMTLPNNY